MKMIAFYNNKGGVGKTSTAINIAYTLSRRQNRILQVDFDGQCNSSRFFTDFKSATTQKVSLGDDPNGNITRIDNAIGRIPDHIENAKAELKNIQTQYETAQIEVQKPFAQEEELKAKTKRQIEVEKLISSGENEPEQNAISDYYYFSATDEQINALNNASIPFEKQTKADGSMVIRVATDDKSKAEAIMNSKNLILQFSDIK